MVRKNKRTKRKLPTIYKLKRKLWSLFSIYIRLRDANKQGTVKCCTCDRVYYWTDSKGRMQAGHFLPQKGNPALIFEETNVHGQCARCNGAGAGEQYLYSLFIVEKYGKDVLNKLILQKNKKFKFTRDYLNAQIVYYGNQIQKLKNSKHL